MNPEQPPQHCSRKRVATCPESVGFVLATADELVAEIEIGGHPFAQRIAEGLQRELRTIVTVLARQDACVQALVRAALEDVAQRLEAAATQVHPEPGPAPEVAPLPLETQVRALIARLRVVSRT